MVAYGHAPDDSVMVRQNDRPKLLPLGHLYQPLDGSKPTLQVTQPDVVIIAAAYRHDTRDAIRQAVTLVNRRWPNTLKLRDNRMVTVDPTGRLTRVTHSTLVHKVGHFGRNLPGLRVTSATGPAPTGSHFDVPYEHQYRPAEWTSPISHPLGSGSHLLQKEFGRRTPGRLRHPDQSPGI
eukprot:CAMPEP_0118915866 /NCGR_PEP_ID=MMETSP1166-20130328/15972_1 /TAXON_ID=1104430 /ORGANISM="Chrysoreinhardia sp, Strain CCMP3193" /LENGTH=178 /DNA_ID=CAMNT_0006855627 /DNA_START=469 /DNA_END=1005 /DNA_ORIENTATION=-